MECCIFYRNKTKNKSSGGGYESLIKLRTKEAADILKQCVTNKNNNPPLLAWVAGRDVSSIISIELHYHRSCYRSYTRISTKHNIKNEEKIFKEVEQYLNQKVIGNFEVVTIANILEIYQQSNGKSISSAEMQEYINESFADIDSWTPKYYEKFFFNLKGEKGQISEHFLKRDRKI